jgi:hypothetical protein
MRVNRLETMMKHLLSIVIFTGLAAVTAQPVLAANGVCLTVRDIADSQASKDGTSITFKMRDGKLWRNDLKGYCPDLWFNGFAMVEHADTICENEPGLKVIHSGEICALGKFTKVIPAQRG